MKEKKPPSIEISVSEWRDHQLFVVSTLNELKSDTKDILAKLQEHEKEITHLKWKSGLISALVGVISGLGVKFTNIFH